MARARNWWPLPCPHKAAQPTEREAAAALRPLPGEEQPVRVAAEPHQPVEAQHPPLHVVGHPLGAPVRKVRHREANSGNVDGNGHDPGPPGQHFGILQSHRHGVQGNTGTRGTRHRKLEPHELAVRRFRPRIKWILPPFVVLRHGQPVARIMPMPVRGQPWRVETPDDTSLYRGTDLDEPVLDAI